MLVVLGEATMFGAGRITEGQTDPGTQYAGAVTFTPAGTGPPVLIASSALRCLQINLDADFAAAVAGTDAAGWRPIVNEDLPKIAAIGRAIALAVVQRGADVVVHSLMTALARTLARQFGSALPRGGDGWLNPEALRRIVETIEADPSRRHSLVSLAMTVGLSTSALLRAFRGSVGITPGAFIIERRIVRAGELLITTRMPLAAIAEQTGFATASHLIGAFRARRGITPGQLRRTQAHGQ